MHPQGKGRPNSHPIDKVPIHLIMTFTAKESAGYHDIGINKTDHMFRSLNCLFALFVGTKNRKSYERSLVKKSAMRYTVLCSSVLFLLCYGKRSTPTEKSQGKRLR